MGWQVVMNLVIDAQPLKYLERLNEPMKGRLLAALERLECEPPAGDIKKLRGSDHYRLRVGGYRVIFSVEEKTVIVAKIAPRGQAYKD
jgi:mRNA interferase RelE/StbE